MSTTPKHRGTARPASIRTILSALANPTAATSRGRRTAWTTARAAR